MTDRRFSFLLAVGVTFFVWGLLGVVLGPLLPEIQRSYALSSTAAGLVFFLWSVGFSLGSLLSRGVLENRSPILLLAGLNAIAGLAAGGLYAAPGYTAFASAFLVIGLAGGATFTAGHTLIGRTFVRHRVAALSALDIVFSVGNLSAPLAVIALLAAGQAWNLPFLLLAGLFGTSSVICLGVALAVRPHTGTVADGTSPNGAIGSEVSGGRPVGLAALALTSFALGWLEQGQHVWLVSYGIDAGQDERTARLGHAMFLGGMIAVRLLAVAFNHRMQHTAALRLLFAVTAAGALLLVLGRTEILFLGGSAMLGAGIGALFPIFLGRATDADPGRTATFSVVMIVSVAVGGQLASLGIGALSDLFGTTSAYAANLAAVALLVGAAEWFRAGTCTGRADGHRHAVGRRQPVAA